MEFTDLCLISEDVARLKKFYEAVFCVPSEGDNFHATIALDGLQITFDAAKGVKDSPSFGYVSGQSSNNTIIGFNVADVDAEYKKLHALGVCMLNQPTTHPWGARSFQFRDPDGNILNFRTVKK